MIRLNHKMREPNFPFKISSIPLSSDEKTFHFSVNFHHLQKHIKKIYKCKHLHAKIILQYENIYVRKSITSFFIKLICSSKIEFCSSLFHLKYYYSFFLLASLTQLYFIIESKNCTIYFSSNY